MLLFLDAKIKTKQIEENAEKNDYDRQTMKQKENNRKCFNNVVFG